MFGIGLEADLGGTFRAASIESEFRDREIFFVGRLFVRTLNLRPLPMYSPQLLHRIEKGVEKVTVCHLGPLLRALCEPARVEIYIYLDRTFRSDILPKEAARTGWLLMELDKGNIQS